MNNGKAAPASASLLYLALAIALAPFAVPASAADESESPRRFCTMAADSRHIAKSGDEGHSMLASSDDGWPLSTPAAEGLDPKPLEALVEAVGGWRFEKVDGILIARHGKLVLEAYFNGYGRETKHDTRSAFKSFTSTLIGIAIDRGLIADVDRPVAGFFADHPAVADWDARKRHMTLGHLLTMTAGFDAEEAYGIGPWRESDMWKAADWIAFALAMPMARDPGEAFSYNTPTSVLLGGILAQAAGEPVVEFAKRELFGPLGMTDYCWTLSPRGQAMTGGSFLIRPRDMAKLGQVFLDGGTWRGERIVSEAWVAAATAPRVDAAGPGDWTLEPMIKAYGYQWWTRRWRPGDRRFDSFYALGNGGQKIMVFPHLDMVVVFTGSSYNHPRGHQQTRDMLRHYVFRAVEP